ncbi:hypothetical protein [Comamonas sp. lk]|uniref:hypothetical protein n=1 Tax=Comamonas sp. lk TaxID=2201272 RepID=UPI0013CE8E5D|nr:hypothetical protein [Comamonas sp. lk]
MSIDPTMFSAHMLIARHMGMGHTVGTVRIKAVIGHMDQIGQMVDIVTANAKFNTPLLQGRLPSLHLRQPSKDGEDRKCLA